LLGTLEQAISSEAPNRERSTTIESIAIIANKRVEYSQVAGSGRISIYYVMLYFFHLYGKGTIMLDRPNKEYVEYSHWKNMRARCSAPSIHKARPKYKNIEVCKEWDSFEQFYKDMGPKPFNTASIDRKDNNLGYNKDNCRWANDYEQARNTSKNVTYEYNGFIGTVPELSERFSVSKDTLYKGLQNGRTLEAIITVATKKRTIEYNGLELTKKQWANKLGIKLSTMYARFNNWGDDLDRILTK
jgi:hypothetical protein